MQDYYLPSQLDAPARLLIFTWDEVLIFTIILLFFFLCFDALLTGALLGSGSALGLKHFKQGEKPSYWLTLMYWYLPSMIRYRVTPASHIRVFIG